MTDPTHGCLGYDTPASVRQSVIEHDIQKLIERTTRGIALSRMDFETLIHQCRKRKWKDQVALILDAMVKVSTIGVDELSLAPQVEVQPTDMTYLALIDAYICCFAFDLAWQVFEAMDDVGIPRTQAIVRKYIRGCFLASRDNLSAVNVDDFHLDQVIALALRDGIPFTQRMIMYLMRLHGSQHATGLALLQTLSQHGTLQVSSSHLYDELIQSCVYAHNVPGAIAVWDAFQAQVQTLGGPASQPAVTTATIERVLLLTCFHHSDMNAALQCLETHQTAKRLACIPTYASIVREFFIKYTSDQRMNGPGLAKSLKVCTSSTLSLVS